MEAAEFQQALVLSCLLGGARVAAYCRFVQDARRLSQQLGVRGALLFDGEITLQLIEGDAHALDQFITALYGGDGGDGADRGEPQPGVTVLARGPVSSAALPPRWCAGYTEPQALDAWCVQPSGSDEAAPVAISRFLELRETVDCE